MRRLWAGVALMVVMGGCGESAEAGGGTPAVSSSPPAAARSWYSVAGNAPVIKGAVLDTTSPLASMNGFDDEAQFQRLWAYTGTVMSVTVDIDRANPHASKRDEQEWGLNVSRRAGHLVVPLSGVGDSGAAILDKSKLGAERPLVRAQATSGNAVVSLLVRLDGAIADEAALTARAPELIAVLDEVLDDLRPR